MNNEELKWMDDIITGINTPNVSGYVIVRNGVIESNPIPKEFNRIIAELLRRFAELERIVKSMESELRKWQKTVGLMRNMKLLYQDLKTGNIDPQYLYREFDEIMEKYKAKKEKP